MIQPRTPGRPAGDALLQRERLLDAAIDSFAHTGIGSSSLRSIADKADEGAVVDKQKFYAMAAKNSATLVAAILKGLEP